MITQNLGAGILEDRAGRREPFHRTEARLGREQPRCGEQETGFPAPGRADDAMAFIGPHREGYIREYRGRPVGKPYVQIAYAEMF
ncbi:hypothetical protein PSDVSF_13140 [Pseudodesulfovibrio sediminis]|uniref:Uncharacterized protein n=1 Tax=Pseudodesulfovibrio sediminis TaxID=2810563 RepID=A0ABN6ERL1_9BACT|nr:hypothetical protein PSDVSF_13140 [Pseudodesulfovibrio sediminis]